MVRLGLRCSYLSPGGRASFNPTVVRLGLLLAALLGLVGDLLSIPLWCDWDLHLPQRLLEGLPLSIPLWCDWDFEGGRV